MRLLLVAYHYPPDNNGGTQRPWHFRRNLTALGHEVTVLTHGADNGETDGVIRIRTPDQARRLTWMARRATHLALARVGIHRSPYWTWRGRAIAALDRILARAKPEAVITTFPPVEALEVGLSAATRSGARLIVDLRDGLLFEPIDKGALRRGCTARHYARLEAALAERAAAVVTVSPPISEDFARRHPGTRVETIPNGFAPEDFAGAAARPAAMEAGRTHIVFTGRLANSEIDCDVAPFLAALRQTHASSTSAPVVHFIGTYSRHERRLMQPLEAQGSVRVHAPMPRGECLAWQRAADALLLITSIARTSIATTKLFEYLAAGRPILALTSGTFAEQIVVDTGTGWTAHPRDVAAISRLLTMLPTLPLPPRDEDRIRGFTRRAQAERLDALLGEVCRPR